ncbi:MAG TPA: UDP-N-acetylmuramoyl-L-alanyl-D-glutamate--2,6-diaminopimelate ligase, partial [Thermomicrobiales bacterium]|nr:UDP-N-acetylmuramoyl-L-alanyl-D-glutamate--2,6-diaminopimelate ligase [Thermomicrobiales bacterium]
MANGLPQPAPRSVALSDLVSGLSDARVLGDPNAIIRGITYDSRLVGPGALFAALPGADFDGHDYIGRAVAAGAAALLVERPSQVAVPQIVVRDSREALASVANAFYGNPSLELSLIGVTGTDGKTTTGFLVDHLLRSAGLVTGTIGTVGIRIGPDIAYELPHQTTPESNLLQGYLREMVERGVSHAVVEATSHGLAMHRLDGTRFSIAAVTNMTHEHLEYHGTVENYWRAKAVLVERVAANAGTVVLNADDAGAMSALPYAGNADVVTTSGSGNPADLVATDREIRPNGTSFTLHVDEEVHQVAMPLVGGFNIDNALIAIAVGCAAGLPVGRMVAALATAGGVPGRMQTIDEGQRFTVIVDYAHTPESLRKVLTLLREMGTGRIIVVSGSAGERDPSKRPLQGAVCTELADL